MRIRRLGNALGPGGINEEVDVNYENVQGATITNALPVALCTTTSSNDGNNAVLPAAANALTFIGVALGDTPNNGFGLARAYGFVNSVRIFAHGTSVTTAAGVAIGPAIATSNGFSSTGLVTAFGPLVSMEAIGAAVNSPGGYAKAFVRAM